MIIEIAENPEKDPWGGNVNHKSLTQLSKRKKLGCEIERQNRDLWFTSFTYFSFSISSSQIYVVLLCKDVPV